MKPKQNILNKKSQFVIWTFLIDIFQTQILNLQTQLQIFQTKMEIKLNKRTSINKINKEKQLNMTVSTALFPVSQKEIKQLPPIKRNLRKPLQKIELREKSFQKKQRKQISFKKQKKQSAHKKQQQEQSSHRNIQEQSFHKKQRKQTETTLNESVMQQSYFFSTISKGWIKPSDYLNDIKELNLQGQDGRIQLSDFEIKLNDKIQKNMQKIQALSDLTCKWVDILRRANFYISSKKSNSQKLSQEVKFWRLLSKKYDELQYEFNSQKTKKLYTLMKTSLKTNPQHRKVFQEFEGLKDKVIGNYGPIKRLYLTLEQVVAGAIIKFQECSCIKQSIQLLKKILFCFSNLQESNSLLENRIQIVYKKINLSLIQKLLAAPIYPKELANISGLKFRYEILDSGMSFCSNFISILEQDEEKFRQIIDQAEYTRNVISNLIEILCYFEFLYKKKEVLEFSKLFGYQIDFNIFQRQNQKFWDEYMDLVRQSMAKKGFEAWKKGLEA